MGHSRLAQPAHRLLSGARGPDVTAGGGGQGRYVIPTLAGSEASPRSTGSDPELVDERCDHGETCPVGSICYLTYDETCLPGGSADATRSGRACVAGLGAATLRTQAVWWRKERRGSGMKPAHEFPACPLQARSMVDAKRVRVGWERWRRLRPLLDSRSLSRSRTALT